MKSEAFFNNNKLIFIFLIQIIAWWYVPAVFCYPVQFTDAGGNNIIIKSRPQSVVSLVPSISEILFKIGAGDAVQGITFHTAHPFDASNKTIVGSFSSPSISRIKALNPEVVFYSSHNKKVWEQFRHQNCQLINLKTDSIADSCKNIRLLGQIFNREHEAQNIINEIKSSLQTIQNKVAKIPYSNHKRVIRFMGLEPLTVPGDDSFQNDFIRTAGGIPPIFNKQGSVVTISQKEWIDFNPQVIYGCGVEIETAKKFFSGPGYKDVEAVQQGKIYKFPCDLTCRAATNSGYFVSWLAAMIYKDEFSKKENQVIDDKTFKSRKLHVDLDYIKDIRIAYSHIRDFINKTLIIDFKKPLSVVSTLEGQRQAIESVGNHYASLPCWIVGHNDSVQDILSRVYDVIGKSADTASFMLTGADMDNLSIKHKRFREMEVYALVTAGVESNAVRMSKDQGKYYEPGTINIILLTNMELTNRAMTRAIITATEAKTATLLDMDTRSSYSSRLHRATGTGTDNIIVVQGAGVQIDNAGGHAKMGELIAGAVYEGVQEAIRKQNAISLKRNVFQRLKERKIRLYGLISDKICECNLSRNDQIAALEKTLLDPRYAGFIESSFALSDDYEKGLFTDLDAYDLWCKNIAEDIAGRKIEDMQDLVVPKDLPVVLKMALNAIINGIYYKTN
ncbi:MAG: adenosylcobinamide amidohydrolase [Desulfobacterales bacterium]|uniref:Adenosylcobinamide amidohydrolase n=1 Tax=Candidatus Desulfatibia vada TaxID=2841696 RepID=A0A8J6P0J5_9BACT|nr:adenosylcobinamide amidohydrolase [Candidatus Desulfatibia vada]MBL6972428.1 adenosylcobinamide amidohydrolase [Desulfobacterales bacterium]